MTNEELKKYSLINEETLSFFERIALQRLSKKGSESVIKIFNKNPEYLRTYELIYISKYVSKEYSFYENEGKVLVAPKDASKEELQEFGVPEIFKEKSSDEFYTDSGIGYRNLRVYNIMPGIKYKLMKGHSLTGYASFDRQWEMLISKIDIDSNNMLDFYKKSRRFLGPKKCKYAFQSYDQKVTWEEFKQMVNKYTKSLAAMGVKKGDVIPICITSTVEATALYFAIDAIGATTFYIDPNETSVENINKYFKRFDCKLTFTMCKNLEKINQSTEGTNVSKIITLSPTDSMNIDDNLSQYSIDYIKNNTIKFEENEKVKSNQTFIDMGQNYTGNIEYCYDNNVVSLITSTSSSTGEPKLIELSRENIMFELETIKKTTNIYLGPNGINMQIVPFKYPYGFIVSTLISAYVGKISGMTPDFTLNNYVKFLKMYKPAYCHMVPSLVKNMIKNPELANENMSYLRYIICGGDKYETNEKKYANEWLKKHSSSAEIKDASGMAEVTAGITAATVGKYNVESVGKPMIGTIVKVMDENNQELPYGHIGQLWYSGKNVMKQYNNDEEKTNQIKYTDENGKTWIITDSKGFIDNEGFVYMCGRNRDFFITYFNGEAPQKVYTERVETVINSCEEVFESVVVKKPSDISDFEPRAYVTLKSFVPPEKYDEIIKKIMQVCEQTLDKAAIPKIIEIVPELKIKPSLKVDKIYYETLAKEEYKKETKNKEAILK